MQWPGIVSSIFWSFREFSNNSTSSSSLGRHISEFEEAESMSSNILFKKPYFYMFLLYLVWVGGVGGWRLEART